LQSSQHGSTKNIDDESKANDCAATHQALSIVLFRSEGADCQEKDRKAISKEEVYP
jgi:hypothetical protein